MKLAQLEIKATVTVNTSDLGNRKRDDDSQDRDVPVRKKGEKSKSRYSYIVLKRCSVLTEVKPAVHNFDSIILQTPLSLNF